MPMPRRPRPRPPPLPPPVEPRGGLTDLLAFIVYVLAAMPAIRAISRRFRGLSGGWPGGLWLSGALILLLILAQWMLSIYADLLWFREMAAERRYWTELQAHWASFLLGALVAFVILWL